MFGYSRNDPPLLTAQDVKDVKLGLFDRRRRARAEKEYANRRAQGAPRNASFEATVALAEAIERLKK
jgi:hypothetical protein